MTISKYLTCCSQQLPFTWHSWDCKWLSSLFS